MNRIRLVVTSLTAALLLAVPLARGATSSLVVSQVYAAGGNSGASFTNDFVELFNRGSSSVTLSGWTVQYASAAGTTWQVTPLTGSIKAGGYFLVQLASGGAAGSPLPTPDATGTTNMAASGGKVAVVHDTAALGCGATAGSCSAVPAVEDLLGYGGALDYEGGSPAPALGATTAAVRNGSGCTDTNNNSADFTVSPVSPRHSASPTVTCGGGPPPAGLTQDAAVDIDIQAVLSLALERPTISFGNASAGQTPAAVSEKATVVSNNAAGYMLSIHRTAFAPQDLPLGVASTAPPGTQLGPGLGGGATIPIPIAPVPDALIGSSNTKSAPAGDVWPTSIGFAAPLPIVPAGHYTATITYTLIGK
ncbi:MAG TPA: lamin tail domain-containing protein [Gaiellaceae bacterium]|nr:lamin tail domain-containing protein [Gaiellaceae bacterium]